MEICHHVYEKSKHVDILEIRGNKIYLVLYYLSLLIKECVSDLLKKVCLTFGLWFGMKGSLIVPPNGRNVKFLLYGTALSGFTPF